MLEIKYVEDSDKKFWYSLDKHLPEVEFNKKVRDKQGYVLFNDGIAVGVLRYNLFWDNTPFCTMLFVDWSQQKNGYGRAQVQLSKEKASIESLEADITELVHQVQIANAKGRKIVPAGTVYPANDATAKGIIYQDVDVTNGPQEASCIVEGYILKDRLPVAPAEAAITALKEIKFY